MTDIEQKALALIAPGVACEVNFENISILAQAFTSAIEQHEAFRQEVSDKCDLVSQFDMNPAALEILETLILPAPKPDPLVEVVQNMGLWAYNPARNWAGEIRAALDARGLTITTLEKD